MFTLRFDQLNDTLRQALSLAHCPISSADIDGVRYRLSEYTGIIISISASSE